MRHGKKIHKLERPGEHRLALMSNLVTALITHKRIKTTESKAKALKPVIDDLITTAKKNTVNARRLAAKMVKQKEPLKTLFDEIAPGMLSRTSGYSRIMRVGTRSGDGAEIVVIELIMDQEVSESETPKKSKKKLFGRKSAPKTTKAPAAEKTVEAKAEASQDDAAETDESEKPEE